MVKTPIPLKKASAERAPQTSSAATSHSQAVETGAPRRKTTIKKRVKQSLIATALAGMLAGIALTVWIVNSETETLILRAANYALRGTDSELTDIRLGKMGLSHWHVSSANLRVHDSHLVINNLDIQLELNWPKSFEELKQLVQVENLTQKIKRISTGEIAVELGASLLERSPNIADEQTPALALNIKSLPLIEIGKTTLKLKAQANHSAYQLVMEKLSLNHYGQLTTAFSHEDEPLISLAATLGNDEWTLKSELNIAPLLESLHQISLRQTPTSILSQLIQWDQQWQALGMTLSGQLVSQSTFKLTTGDIKSEHQFIQPSVTLAHFADFTLAPQPTLAFNLSGSLAALNLTLEPFSLALTPNAAQQALLLDALNHSLQLNDTDYRALNTLLSGLKSTQSPIGLAFLMTEPLHYTFAKSDEPLTLPAVELSTLGSKLETHIRLTNTRLNNKYLTKESDTWMLQTQWHIALKQNTPLNLRDLDLHKRWQDAPQALNWGSGALQTAGTMSLKQSVQGIDWQLKTAPFSTESTDTLQLTLRDIQLDKATRASDPQNKQTQLGLGKIELNAKAPLTFSSTSFSAQDATTTAGSQFALNLPPVSLALAQLRFSQAVETLAIDNTHAQHQTQTLNNSTKTSLSSRSDITVQDVSLGVSQGVAVNFSSQNPFLTAIQSSQIKNTLHWQAKQLSIEKLLSAKGRTRKQTVLKLDNLALVQDLHWKNNTLIGNEQWQVGNVQLQSHHQLQFANANLPLLLTGQWVADTSMTEALSLLNQTQPLPTEFNMTGHNQLQAQFKLTHQPEQTQFAMQITQSMTELEGFYKDILFEGGKLQAQCEFTWGQSYKTPQASGYFSSLSRLNCPQTMINFNLFDPGFPLTDIEVEADIVLGKDAEKLPDNWLQQLTGLSDTDVSMTAKGKVLSGQFLLPDFNLKLQDKSHAYLLLQGMNLEEVLRIQPQIGIYADGIFDGVLPVDLVDGKVSISGGQLAARAPGGLIAISGNPAVDQMRQSQPYLDFVFSALEHLEYSQLSSSFDMDQTGDANLLVEVKGRSKGIERPIHLNYSHEENMLQLFRSLQIGNDLQDRIEKSVK
ncbi:YdbH domain-containing protein [Shewanella xiamenensis]|uniref:YdbH domain-containing protein n=1 Tax=Shewanella xiamenensis TaxID=332186 RepID=UPI0024A69618|nr:YdbH domain-containing protein [Shewanella xiamenensis]MDI5837381.1 YdbH domain-containing protein [Shewanella xiamenensis]MDI5840356.1 YdbH domain-containing protein [Shewanella xiamenensis]MDI5844411.1 YdbH domain-containing protein [Shewanella xiamenensis]MDI5847999.1 YdbH domain-containing protein [Shewanella xiamenensis]MDI5852291.1 YdbH domain-containing protein [Shewanella xiamenensis]